MNDFFTVDRSRVYTHHIRKAVSDREKHTSTYTRRERERERESERRIRPNIEVLNNVIRPQLTCI